MIAIVILCKELTENHDIKFYKNLKKNNYDVFICVDIENDLSLKLEKDDFINIITVDHEECISSGFSSLTTFTTHKKCTAWDKSIYYFSMKNLDYEHIWIIEDDVFLPNVNCISNMDKKYGEISDYLCQFVVKANYSDGEVEVDNYSLNICNKLNVLQPNGGPMVMTSTGYYRSIYNKGELALRKKHCEKLIMETFSSDKNLNFLLKEYNNTI